MSEKPQLRMWRDDLEGLPPVALEADCAIRPYKPGDGPHWERIIATSFQADPARFDFDRMMRSAPCYRPERVLFLTVDARPVATASAWYHPDRFPDTGTIHYVGVEPGHQGRKLGYWVSLAALHHMVEEGRRHATLLTDDFRLAALKTYLRLRFRPMLVHENQRQRWREVFANLGLAEASERYADSLDGPVWTPPSHPRDEYDYDGLLATRHRHHPGRQPGRPSVAECAAFGDESLYRPSQLGRAGISPQSVVASEDRPFELWFEAGPNGIPPQTEVLFHVLGQKPLGAMPQWHDPSRAGHIELDQAGSSTVHPLPKEDTRMPPGSPSSSRTVRRGATLGFRVGEDGLAPAERVTLSVGRTGGFSWTPLAGRKEFHVLVDPGFGEPVQRLPEPVVLTVLPAEPDRLEMLTAPTATPGERIEATVSVRDRYDNRVPIRTEVTVTCDDQPVASEVIRDGHGLIEVGTMQEKPVKWRVQAGGLGLEPAMSNPVIPRDLAGQRVFFGDLHVHDLTCPAEGYTADVYRWARDEKRLDFMSLAPQCHAWVDNEAWLLQKHACEMFLDEGRFVTLSAFEWQHSHYGDKVVHYLGGDQPYLPVDDPRYAHPAALYDALRATDALVIGHHPGYGLDLHVPGTDWDAVEDDVERLVELWSMHGSSEGYDPDDRPLVPPRRQEGVMAALRAGLRLGFTGGSDTHSGRPGGSAKEPRPYWGGLCGLWAETLTRRGLFEALRSRRTYAVKGRRTILHVQLNGCPMGAEAPFSEHREMRIRAWAPVDIQTVEILRDTMPWQTFEVGEPTADIACADSCDQPSFYHARVTLSDGSLAVASPIWVGCV